MDSFDKNMIKATGALIVLIGLLALINLAPRQSCYGPDGTAACYSEESRKGRR